MKTPARSSRSENSDRTNTSHDYVQSTSTSKGCANKITDFNSSLSPIEERKSVNTTNKTEQTDDVKRATQIKRLGVSGPKTKMSTQMDDISGALAGRNSITVRKVGDKEVIVRLGCNKCRKDFYTMAGYESHLLMDHRIQNSRLHPPKLIEKEDITLSPPSFNNSKIEDEDETLKKKPNEGSSGSTVENDASLPEIIPPSQRPNPLRNDDRKFVCEFCPEAFFYVAGLDHHLNNAHSKQISDEEDADDEAEQREKGDHSSRSKVKNTKPDETKPGEKSVGARKTKCKGVPMKVKESVVETVVKTVRYTRSQAKKTQQLAEQIQEESKDKTFLEKSSDLSRDDFAKEYNLWKRGNLSSSATITVDEEKIESEKINNVK